MNSTEIFNLIESIAAVSGKNEKQDLLATQKDSFELKRVLQFAYDPFVTFGVAEKTLDEIDYAPGALDFGDDTWKMMDNLAERDLSGTAAVNAIAHELSCLNEQSGTLLRRILLKDLRAGFGESTINKVIKGLIPEFPYMRCSLPDDAGIDTWDWSQGHISQEKADGMFMNTNVRAGTVWMCSRQGTLFPINKVPTLYNQIKLWFPEHTQTHGELLVVREDGSILPREEGNGELNSLIKGGKLSPGLDVVLRVWDRIPLDCVKPKGKCEIPYRQRLMDLTINLAQMKARTPNCMISLAETKIVYTIAEAKAHCAYFTRQKKEGSILKRIDGIWRDTGSSGSKDMVKFKIVFEVDLKIVGFEEGKGKRAETFGSIIVESSDGLLQTSVSGFSDEQIAEVHANRDRYLGTIMTVEANDITEPKGKKQQLHSLYLPRFKEFRLDKSEADSLQRIKDQLHAARNQ